MTVMGIICHLKWGPQYERRAEQSYAVNRGISTTIIVWN